MAMTKHKTASLYLPLAAILFSLFFIDLLKPWQKLESQVPTAKYQVCLMFFYSKLRTV